MKLIIFYFILCFATVLSGETLQQVFQNSGPAFGYDRYVVLSPNTVYTGGAGIYEGSVFVEGNGAVIDLQDGVGIWVYAEEGFPASLTIYRCTIINGANYGLNFSGTSTGTISNCNLINNDMGIQFMDSSTVEVRNCNFVDNATYGLAIYSTNPAITISYCNAWNNGEDYMENCPG